MRNFFCILTLTLSFLETTAFGALEKTPLKVRVLILNDAKELKLAVHSSYKIMDTATNRELLSGKWLSQRTMSVDSSLHLREYTFDAEKIIVMPHKDGKIFMNGRYFRGDLVISKREKNLYVINILDIDDYLRGVLYHEVSPEWPIEVLKAQAIVARTFALYQSTANKTKDYDLTSDTFSQMYGGLASERVKTNLAVSLTKGKVLTYNYKVFPAYYHATCAGSTEDASVLWNIDIPPLKGVRCNFCNDSPHLKWDAVFDLKDIEKKLNDNSFNIKDITDINIVSYTPSGRVNMLIIKSGEEEFRISAKQLRQTLGSTIIRSTNFSVKVDKDSAIFKGLGWGHGVGMCQWGANFMAQYGSKADEILKFYYPETEIVDINSL